MKEKQKNIWIFAGEESGDIYGASLAREIQALSSEENPVRVAGMGGARMKDAGVDILVDSTELGVVGLIEIMGQIFTHIPWPTRYFTTSMILTILVPDITILAQR